MNTPLPEPEPSLQSFARYVAGMLRDTLGVELPAEFERQFQRSASRVGPSSYEDLGGWVLLECLEERKRSGSIDGMTVLRVLDRVRHRISRRAAREIQSTAEPSTRQPARSEATVLREFFLIVKNRLSPLHLVVFDLNDLRGHKIDAIAEKLGLSPATVYRLRKETRNMLHEFLGQRGP